MPACIYCKQYKSRNQFSNREHIIPQAFGKFTPQNLILNAKNQYRRDVCNHCNNEFSTLERWLAKDTLEGYIGRAKHGWKIDLSKRLRVKIRVAEGDHKGLQVKLVSNDTIQVLPQIGLEKKAGGWDYFLPHEIDKIKKKKYILITKDCFRAYCLSDDERIDLFKKIGIKFVGTGNLNPPPEKILCEIKGTVDKNIRRIIAKVAFNFFSYFNYKYIVLNGSFDAIRKFILNGGDEIPIKIEDKPILTDEKNSHFRRVGHIVTINSSEYGDLIAQVALFNYLTYTVLLAEKFSHKKLKIRFGRYFDIKSKKIEEMRKSSLSIPVKKIITPKRNIWIP